MKYLIYKDTDGYRKFVLFDKGTGQSAMAVAVGAKKIIAAGFCDLKLKECYGHSVSLGVKARPKKDKQYMQLSSNVAHPEEANCERKRSTKNS